VLRQWLPNVIQQVEPWMSEEDIHAGKRWLDVLLKELEQTNFGIIALTPENARSPWILFEAGALAKQIDESAVCPYLVDIAETTDVIGPLAQFQSKKATKADTLALLKDINGALGEEKLPEPRLLETFERWWPDLEKAINTPPPIADKPKTRSDRELLEEILERVRSFERQSSEGVRGSFPSGEGWFDRLMKGPVPGLTPDAWKALGIQDRSAHDEMIKKAVEAAIAGIIKPKKKTGNGEK
jgi:hypothetical protein